MVMVDFDRESIEAFIKETLGCSCPEEVFEHIRYQPCIKLNERITVNKITIDKRLLIYLVENNNPDSIKALLPFLVDIGRNERDSFRYNRFRLVFATSRLKEVREVAETLFRTIDRDERVHLHVISKDRLPVLTPHVSKTYPHKRSMKT